MQQSRNSKSKRGAVGGKQKNFQFITDTAHKEVETNLLFPPPATRWSELNNAHSVMEEAEKMVALKKAYADIILNTAKEAAARIMVSERKALRFHQDLYSAKDEALYMLLRLKQRLDSKTNEAEKTSLNQRSRIEELEAQLHEAEGAIVDLRTELKWVQDELEKVKNNQVQPLNGQIAREDAPSPGIATHEDKLTTPEDSEPDVVTTSNAKNAPLNQRILDNKCCNATEQTEMSSHSHLENYNADNPELASIIMRSKEPELYRNGCTQRIRAFERNVLDGKLPPSGDVDDQQTLMKNESIIKSNEKGEGTFTVPSPKTENMDKMKNTAGLEEVKQINSGARDDQPIKVIRRLRRRRTRYGKAKVASRRPRPCQPMKPAQPPSLISHCKSYSDLANDNVKSGGPSHVPSPKADNMDIMKNSTGLEEKLQNNSNCYEDKDQAVKTVRRGYRKRKVKYRDAISMSCRSPDQLTKSCQSSSILSRCKNNSYSVNGNVESGEDLLTMTEDEAKMKPLSHLDLAGNTSGLVQNVADKDSKLIDEFISVKQEGDTAESSGVSSYQLKLEMVDVPAMNSDSKDAKASKATDGAPGHVERDRLLKYTFQRKRKKESLSNPDENTSHEKSTMKRRAGEKQNGAPEPQKSSLIDESSRDSRRLVQVARQLISLSGKRWW